MLASGSLLQHGPAPDDGGPAALDSPWLDLRWADCMAVMAGLPDHAFDLAIVDPPYGTGMAKNNRCGRLARYGSVRQADDGVPAPAYFAELRRVSRNQIIWGGNYFHLPPCRCFIVWDKQQPEGVDFADAEFAWTSFARSARTFRCRPQNADPERIHPTQKPVRLYDWLLENFARPGYRILDTHMGGGSIAIACHYRRHPLTACEIDPEFYAAAVARVRRETAQLTLLCP
jgi:site-specific DNA-methyltransferase (adenine-specific)